MKRQLDRKAVLLCDLQRTSNSVRLWSFKKYQQKHVFQCRLSCHLAVAIVTDSYVEIKCQLDATDDIYCMLNMFRAILCPSSGAREYYTDGRCLWYLVLWFSGCRYGVELKVMCPVRFAGCSAACKPDRTHNLQLHTIPTT